MFVDIYYLLDCSYLFSISRFIKYIFLSFTVGIVTFSEIIDFLEKDELRSEASLIEKV